MESETNVGSKINHIIAFVCRSPATCIGKTTDERRRESLENLHPVSLNAGDQSLIGCTRYVVMVRLISETETFMSRASESSAGK